ncbi:MAG TPA: hypothetical protein VM681_05065 [Candidatus Thermoplasmatota archaeon]|nr:hypothetical protein [Candidatus Thermoplasmatota archaeon]
MAKVRWCVVCRREKPVHGVWYLLDPRAPSFACEGCFVAAEEIKPLPA